MTHAADFKLINKLTELNTLMSRVGAWCGERGLSEETVYEVNLIVDEVVSSSIYYVAYRALKKKPLQSAAEID